MNKSEEAPDLAVGTVLTYCGVILDVVVLRFT